MSAISGRAPLALVDLNGKLSRHPRFAAAITRIGVEGAPVIVIDHFLSNPELLVEYAAANCAFEGVSDAFYPGVRAPIAPIYCFALRAFLGGLIAEAFGLTDSLIMGELAHFSLVTTAPGNLNVLQRMPHIDHTDPKQLAVLHYLCAPEHGGTSFYRHRRTGFEFIDDARSPAYRRGLSEELASLVPPPSGYICGDSAMFERTASFAAGFNRVLIYRSINLHSADIPPGFAFSADPRIGRLTANTFFYYR
jgi:Family of unknown function (DUF6445)